MTVLRLILLWAFLTSAALSLVAQDNPPRDGTDIPDPVPLVDTTGYDLRNFLLLGSDTSNPQNSGRTDVIMLVSVNRSTGTVALLSIPRDLYVYIPGWEMGRINTAYGHGESIQPGTGPQLLEATIRYNLGLQVDRYARVDFLGFKRIIDAVGGVEVSVDCAIEDWRLKEPDLDPTMEDNWVMYTLPIGVQQMDGDLALWYVRSRRTSSDIDRGQRQQALMRALWQHVRQLGLLDQVTDIWSQLLDVVETDITLSDALDLVPVALQLDLSRVSSSTFQLKLEVDPWKAPDGAQVLLPRQEAVASLIHDFVTPATSYQFEKTGSSVRILNDSGFADLSQVVADKLAWEGFVTSIDDNPVDQGHRELTSIVDYTGQPKGSRLADLQALLRVGESQIQVKPDANRIYDFDVVIGSSFYACTRNVLPPTE